MGGGWGGWERAGVRRGDGDISGSDVVTGLPGGRPTAPIHDGVKGEASVLHEASSGTPDAVEGENGRGGGRTEERLEVCLEVAGGHEGSGGVGECGGFLEEESPPGREVG